MEAVSFISITEDNVGQLKTLNSAIFPVRYMPQFYANVLQKPNDFTRFATVRGQIAGAICCRLEDCKLYIMTLGVLAAYRGQGIGTKMLKMVLEKLLAFPELDEIYLHVHTSNKEALSFYAKNGFQQGEILRNYYRRLDPPDCYILRKSLKVDRTSQEITD